jgi:hypothetical protein
MELHWYGNQLEWNVEAERRNHVKITWRTNIWVPPIAERDYWWLWIRKWWLMNIERS